MKLVVVHDAEGEIVSVARAEPAPGDAPDGGVGAWPERGDRVLELDVTDELAALTPTEIAAQYRVDTKAGKLTEGPESAP
jgi:hypothetical protein